jgi:hypothetical protein
MPTIQSLEKDLISGDMNGELYPREWVNSTDIPRDSYFSMMSFTQEKAAATAGKPTVLTSRAKVW